MTMDINALIMGGVGLGAISFLGCALAAMLDPKLRNLAIAVATSLVASIAGAVVFL